ncbi:putative disease resistance RPP13-like protein 1 isoform X2 [Hevea brasiliensis]|uniref:putative disease resistance RPP13-like protein 1 isoform X2 n=1 Tax=Hevea brasiliensis TaxID=3981 RepID=UPI0025E578B1|nr:putative disease resistance RPP13-like protein 1 isoform X2 [Hevea brasiliensis]
MDIATTIGGAILSPVVEALFDQLASQDLLKYVREGKVLTELNKWKEILEDIYEVLDDAEEQQMKRKNQRVTMWTNKLRDLAYDVEDILDEFHIEARRRELKAGASKVRKLIPTSYSGLNFNAEMISKIKGITIRLEDMRSQKNLLDLSLRVIDDGGRTSRVRDRTTTCVVNKAEVYGREEDKKAILEFLNTESSDARVPVISIIGMGGLGKTTLAQLIFDEVRMKFDLAAWVSVGDDFDVFRITNAVLLSFDRHFDAKNNLNLLQEKLKEMLSENKFMIVLDDVWNDKYEDWTLFRGPFEYGAKGSRIIVTTREQRVSRMMGSVQAYPLKGLSDGDCLSVFAQHALGATNFDEHLDLKAIGERIVQRCDGLPLAAKAIGGILRGQPNQKVWEKVLSNDIWEDKTGILPALRLSYYHLPAHLKRCFAYCAIFPKDYEFDENELVLQWMAEGFLRQQREMKHMEDLGHEYFQDLLSRSFFQQSTSNKSRFVMHDLINDLAQSVSGELCFNLDDKSKVPNSYSKVRHSAFTCHFIEIFQRFEVFYEMNSLRTFLALPKLSSDDPSPYNFLAGKVVHDLVPKLKCLRVLSLAGYQFTELPHSIGALKHLRYLDLSYTCVERLPKSLSNLRNLQTLKLYECTELIELNAGIGNLINLMHLDLSGTNNLQGMPLEIANLTNLQTLSKFIVGEGNGLGIKDLMKFRHLEGRLQIEGLHNVVNILDVELADLRKKESLDELALVWIDNFHYSRSDENELMVLSLLHPHQKLGKLLVKFYGGKKFPSWIGDPSFTNMVDIKLYRCQNITLLPPLGGLPKLTKLSIEGMGGEKQVGVEFYGDNTSSVLPFPSLETLEIKNMLELKQWACSDGLNEEVAGNFPKLCELTIINCPKLIGKLPSCFPSIKKLNIEECQEMILKTVPDLISLTTLSIKRISGLESLHEVVTQALVALEDLEIVDCGQLVYLWQDSTNLDKLTCLSHLKIERCKKLVFLVGGEEGLLPCMLEDLNIDHCYELESLPNGLHSLTSLRVLRICSCLKLVSFPAADATSPCITERVPIDDVEESLIGLLMTLSC